MEIDKNELQNIILGDGQTGSHSQLKTTQNFLRRYAETGNPPEKQQYFKDKETAALLAFFGHAVFYDGPPISSNDHIGEGAEQKVYRFDDTYVLKTNSGIFYESWLDYLNSLLIHNFFFRTTSYAFLGFHLIDGELHAVVKQKFIRSNETTEIPMVKEFLEFNGFRHKRNNDYFNPELGLIFEDLHDENVLSHNGVLYFIDTIFYLTPSFYLK